MVGLCKAVNINLVLKLLQVQWKDWEGWLVLCFRNREQENLSFYVLKNKTPFSGLSNLYILMMLIGKMLAANSRMTEYKTPKMDSKSYANKYFDYENRTGSIVSFICIEPLQNCLLSLFLTETFSMSWGHFFFFFWQPFCSWCCPPGGF